MAKSLRSKRRRKMRALRRQKLLPKELERLEKTVSRDTGIHSNVGPGAATLEPMEVDEDKHSAVETKPKLRQFPGTSRRFPIWMHPRKVKKLAGRRRKPEHRKKKRTNK